MYIDYFQSIKKLNAAVVKLLGFQFLHLIPMVSASYPLKKNVFIPSYIVAN